MKLLDDIRPTWLEVDLDKLEYNIKNIRKLVSKDTKILAVVKADAYGHGAVNCSNVLIKNGADMLGVATLTEAIELREGNIKSPILVMGYTNDSNLAKAVEYDVTQTIYNIEQAEILSSESKKRNKTSKVHIKINTGMSRLGLSVEERSIDIIEKIINMENIEVEGIFSHFIQSDKKDKSIAREQFKEFTWIIDRLEKRHINIPIKHISNSGAVIDLPEYNLDMIRTGILLYGMYPSDEVDKSKVDIKLVSSFKTKISQCRNIIAGDYVGYDQGFIAKKPMRIGTLPVGYSDGYTLEMSELSSPSINNKPVKVIGNICMDQCMIDISDIESLKREDIVSLYRYEGDKIIPELICMIGRRVPRVYMKNEEIILVVDYLLGSKYIDNGEGV